MRHVLWMHDPVRAPVRELFERASRELEDLFVDRLDAALRREGRDESGDAIHGQACVAFALAKGVRQFFVGVSELVDALPKALVLYIAWVGSVVHDVPQSNSERA